MLTKRLERNRDLTVMELTGAFALRPEDFTDVFLPIFKVSSWKRLILSQNRLTNEAISAFAQVIGERVALGGCPLATLWLDSNEITSKGLLSLCTSLRNSGLTELILDSNHIGDEDLDTVCECLKECRALRRLSLSSNNISDVGVKRLCNLFLDKQINCSTFHELDLQSNHGITDDGGRALIKAARLSWLCRVHLDRNLVSGQVMNDLKFILKTINSKRFRLLVVLCSARSCPRVGAKSDLKVLPVELLDMLMSFLMWPIRRG